MNIGQFHALKGKNSRVYEHCVRVKELTTKICDVLGDELTPDQKANIATGAMYHDIGKLAIPNALFNPRRLLNDEEKEMLFWHPIVGFDILMEQGYGDTVSDIALYHHTVADIALYHHWYYDGFGYPASLMQGEQIPIGVRIVSIVDAFDSMSNRDYCRRPHEEALEEIERNAGTQFDPRMVEAFFEVIDH